MSESKPETKQISIRVQTQVLNDLEKIGKEAKPFPAKLNAVISIALAEYATANKGKKLGAK